jgi:hypothetical protein
MAADGPLIGAWHDVPLEIRDLLADVLEGKLKRTGTLAARDIPVDIANQIGTGSFQAINRAFAEDPARAIQILRHIGEDNNQGAGPTAAASFDPLVLHRQGELTAARAQEIASLPPEQLRAAGADPEMWKVVADNLTKAEGSREGGVGVVADQMQYMPADGVPKTASEREATAVIARSLDAEAARGGDLAAFRADADAAYRAAGHGEPPDIRAAEAVQRAPLEGGIAGAEYRKLTAAGVPEEEARTQAEFTQRRYEARAARSPSGETAEQLYRREGEDVVRGQAGELAEGELAQAPNETKGHPEGDAEDAAWRKIEPTKTSTGKYRGAPAWVTNGRQLGKLRRLIRQLIDEGVTGRFWYEDSAKKILQLTRGNLPDAERFMGLLAIYSPQTAVFTNTSFAIKAFRQWKDGEPINVKTGAQDTKAQAWLDRGEDWGGRKTNSFYLNLMHEIITEYPEAVASLNLPPDVLSQIRRATVDLWVLRAMGHDVDSAGGEGDTNKYGFSENEIKRAAGMLNKDLQPGERRWLPHQVQAALWSAIKARYELPAVKEATWAESLKKGFAKMLPDENGKLQRNAPQQSGSDKVGHMEIWRKHALAASPEDVAAQMASARGSFADAIDRIALNVTGEAVPSASLGHAINNATPEAKRQFTHDALQLLIDDDGNDVLAAQLGVHLNFNHVGAGLFEGNINPTVVTTLVPEKPPGFFDKSKALQYARAWQYIFKQDAVPIFRADVRADFAGDYSVRNNVSGAVRRFDTQAEAQEYADQLAARKKNPVTDVTVSGGDLAQGVKMVFAQDLDDATLRRLADALGEELGPDVGFTKTGNRDVAVVNYRGKNGLPDIDDVRFGAAIDKIAARDDLDVATLSHFGSDGEYGPVHDWQGDTSAALAEASGGRPALQSWVADRAAAFDALLDKWSDPAAAHAAAIADRDRIANAGQPAAADTGGALRPEGGGGGGVRSLPEAQRSATEAAAGEPELAGLPNKPIELRDGSWIVPGPFARAKQAAVDYMRKAGLAYDPPRDYVPVDVPRATRIAQAFEDMQHAPDDPAVLASYEAMAKETLAQWEAIKETGLKVEWIKEGQADPYGDNPRRAMVDVIDNNHWWGFPTDLGYGTGDVTERAGNPMLRKTGEVIDGREVVVNDIFRIVHDYFGHIKEGLGFRAGGEENAWRQHAAMYSDEARGAMTAETRGQNSWVNYGPHGETNRTANAADTVYSPQKIGLLPDWVSEEGRVSAPPTELEQAGRPELGPAFREWFGDSKVIDAEGQPLRVYHGTGEDIETFDARLSRRQQKTDAPLFASFFSSDPSVASGYARRGRAGANVVPAYLSLQNPLEVDGAGNGFHAVPSPIEGRVYSRRYQQDIDVQKGDHVDINTLALMASAQGYDGMIVRNVFDAAQRRAPAADTYVAFDPAQVKFALTTNELEQAGRAKVRLSTETERALITLYEGASDASSLIHEKWHVWTDQLFKDAALENASPQLVQDAATLRREVGAAEGEPLTREQLEQLATWGEQYLREGKAPTPELTGVFERFKQWMTEIYQTIKDLGVPINDDVRGVFDRMLTTPEQEAAARGGAGAGDAMASFRTEGRPATETAPPRVADTAAARPAGEPRPTDTLTEIEQHATELEQMQQRLVPEEKLSAESRTEIQAAREAVTEAEGQASALERAALCIMRG